MQGGIMNKTVLFLVAFTASVCASSSLSATEGSGDVKADNFETAQSKGDETKDQKKKSLTREERAKLAFLGLGYTSLTAVSLYTIMRLLKLSKQIYCHDPNSLTVDIEDTPEMRQLAWEKRYYDKLFGVGLTFLLSGIILTVNYKCSLYERAWKNICKAITG